MINKDPIGCRLTELERKALKIMCQQDDRNQSEMLRILIREGAARRGISPLCFVLGYSEVVKPEVQFERP